jgi:hypothetical protein
MLAPGDQRPQLEDRPRAAERLRGSSPASGAAARRGLRYSAPLLFMADGEYLSSLAEDQHLAGDQWGMM